MPTPAETNLSSALAPDVESVYDIVEQPGIVDPLASTEAPELELTEPVPGDSRSVTDEQESMKDLTEIDPNDLGQVLIGDTFEGDPTLPVAAPESSDLVLDEGAPSAVEQDWTAFDNSMKNPEENLVAAVLSKAREFAKYSMKSDNSLRRAIAVCDLLEKQIVAGVIADASEQKLSISELGFLDNIEEGIKLTRAALSQPMSRVAGQQVQARMEQIIYDPFCAAVARILINAQVSGGKKIQDVFAVLKTKYSIDKREELLISQIMMDLGYPCRSLVDGIDCIDQYYA
jgi:hypothetical protein